MPFRNVFIAVVIGTALLVAAFMINAYRPPVVTEQPTASFVRASGKCAECHSNQQYSIVHEYELSARPKRDQLPGLSPGGCAAIEHRASRLRDCDAPDGGKLPELP